jgi:coproporphyrinogen III oxidase
LITFGYLDGVTLIPEYEQMELMEMAMSRNRKYLEGYYADLRARRFALIIAEDQRFTVQKRGAFVEENVAWVRYVGAPLLCDYRSRESLVSNNIQIFEPRPRETNCKDPFSD